ncbi:MAG TPA: WXG100 family type VII secretion target [Candidatus Mediterraneibacter avicola]|nr:WXG100 family type VII secretion target [Candidatus Mediterraneibacter avicola]
MGGIIRVSPEQLISTAGEFSNQGSSISALTGEMMQLVTGLSSVWEGEAATAYMTKFKGLEDDIQRMIRMVQEHASDLEEMASVYTQSDKTGADEASGLLSDVIQ